MNSEEYKRIAKLTIDYVADYRDKYHTLRVYPGDDIEVGYLKKRMSSAYTLDTYYHIKRSICYNCHPIYINFRRCSRRTGTIRQIVGRLRKRPDAWISALESSRFLCIFPIRRIISGSYWRYVEHGFQSDRLFLGKYHIEY